MKHNFKLLFISLVFCSGMMKAQTPSSAPAGTAVASPQTDSRAIAWPGGKTWSYTNPSWPAFLSPCNFFGFRDTLYAVVNGYNTLPPNSACANMSNVIYNVGASNLAAGIVVYTGSTNYYYQNYFYGFQVASLPVRVTIRFTTPSSAAIPVTNINSKKLIKVNQNFNVNAVIEVLSPGDGLYFAGGGNTYTPAITLFDNLHTDPNSSICTSLNQGNYFTFSVSTIASNTGPYCAGQTISLSTIDTAQAPGALTYSWVGPSYNSAAQSPTIINSTQAMAGVYTVTTTDAVGCPDTSSTTVAVETAPSLSACPHDTTIYVDVSSCTAAYTWAPPAVTGVCPATVTSTHAPGDAFPVGNTTVTYTAITGGGDTTTCSFIVSVADTISPVIVCQPLILADAAAGACTAIVNFTAPAGTDNCSAITTQTAGLPSGSAFPIGTTIQTFTATDPSGNSVSCSFTVAITDTEAPSITCNANINVNNDAGQCGAIVNFTAPVGTDNCAGATTTQTAGLASGALFPVGTTTQTFRVTDAAGNTNSCSFNVVVTDTELPVIACNSNITLNNDAGQCGAVVTFTAPTGTDNCTGAITTQTAGLASAAFFPIGTTTQTFTVTDAAGNSASCSFDVTVTDTELPVIICNADTVLSNDTGQCGAVVTFTAPTGTDNCTGTTTTQTVGLASGALFPVGVTTQTFTATDAAGNTASCSFTVTVNDTELPVITCNANITTTNDAGQCGAIVIFTGPTGTDNCTGATTTQAAGLASGALFPLGTTTQTFTVTDAAGNVNSCSFDVIITETEAPVITCNADITVTNDAGQCGAVVIFTAPTGTDNCTGATTTQTAGLASGALFPVGTTVQTFTVTDAAGNTASCSFDVIVTDTELPVIICRADTTLNNDAGQCGAVVTFTAPTGTDNCTGVITTQTAGLASGSLFPIGTTTQTFTATDAAANTSSCSFNVIVTDTELPVIICRADTTVNNDAGQCGAIVNFTAPTGTDNCTGAITTQTAGLASGSLFPIGTTTQTFTATDAAANTSSCSFNVIVTDTELPVIICRADTTVNNDAGQCGAIVNFTAPTGTDNCTGAITTQTAGLASGALFPTGTTTQTFTVTDAAGNISSCSYNVIVTDTELPVIICRADTTVNNDAGQCGAVVNFTAPAGTDNCTGAITTQTAGLASGDLFPVGTTTQTFTVTDAAGNISSCSFNVIVTDTELPVITCNADIAANNDTGQCGAIVSFPPPVATDNCTLSVVQTAGLPSGSLFPTGVTTQTFTATDAAGNSISCSFNVTITDTEVPVVSCTSDITTCDNGSNVITYTSPSATDNCAIATVTQTAGLASGSSFPPGTTTNTFEFTDAAGNTAICSFTVTVNPQAVITFAGVAPVCETDNSFTIATAAPAGGTYSGPGISGTTFDPAAAGVGTFWIVYTVSNANGCSASDSISITVNPTPVVTLSNFNQVFAGSTAFALSGGLPAGGVYSGAGISSNTFNPGTAGIGVHQITYTYTNASGCSDSETASIEVIDDPSLIVYNALTPNGDGIDEAWTIQNIDEYAGNKVQIFNRWGAKVFETTNYKNDWTGGDLPDATYFYILDLNNGEKALTGTVTIIR